MDALFTLAACPHGAKLRIGAPDRTQLRGLSITFPCGCAVDGMSGLIRAPQEQPPTPKFQRAVRSVDWAARS